MNSYMVKKINYTELETVKDLFNLVFVFLNITNVVNPDFRIQSI